MSYSSFSCWNVFLIDLWTEVIEILFLLYLTNISKTAIFWIQIEYLASKIVLNLFSIYEINFYLIQYFKMGFPYLLKYCWYSGNCVWRDQKVRILKPHTKMMIHLWPIYSQIWPQQIIMYSIIIMTQWLFESM